MSTNHGPRPILQYGRHERTIPTWTGFFGEERKFDSFSEMWRSRWIHDEERVVKSDGSVDVKIMARYLREVRNTVRIVFKKRVQVRWAVRNESFCNLETGEIYLSPGPLRSDEPEHAEFSRNRRIDVIHGLALHESAHNAYTPINRRFKMTGQGGELLAQCSNLVEDGYIEAEVMYTFPGFAGYFDTTWDFYINRQNLAARVEEYVRVNFDRFEEFDANSEDDVAKLTEQLRAFLNLAIGACKTREDIDFDRLSAVSDRHAEGIQAIKEMVHFYRMCEEAGTPLQDREDAAKQQYIRIVNFLEPRNDEAKDGSGGDGQILDVIGDSDNLPSPDDVFLNSLPSVIGEVFRDSGVQESQGQQQVSEDGISQQEQTQIESLMDMNYRQENVELFHTGSGDKREIPIDIVDMVLAPYAAVRYREIARKYKVYTIRLKDKLQFRSADVVHISREQEHGYLDKTRLPNLAAYGAAEVFYKKEISSAPEIHLAILGDESGSMTNGIDGSYYDVAVRKDDVCTGSIIMLVNAIKDMRGVSYEVWGHSGDSRGSTTNLIPETRYDEAYGPVGGLQFNGCYVMNYLDSINGRTDPRVLGRITGRSQNYDGMAIDVVARSAERHAPDRRRVLIVVCDGMPSGIGYVGGVEETKIMIQQARNRGTEVYAIFVGSIQDARDQMILMYGRENHDWVQCTTPEALPRAFEKISHRILHWERGN